MDISSIAKMLSRQWRLVVPTVLLVVVLIVTAVLLRPPTHRATSTLILLPPKVAAVDTPSAVNPLERLGDLSVVVDVVRRVLMSDEMVATLEDRGLNGEYIVAANVDFTRGPIVDVITEASSPGKAIDDMGLVVGELEQQLASIQQVQGTSSKYFITSQVVVPATEATAVYSSMVRRLIVSIVLGIGLVIGVAILGDAFGGRISRRIASTRWRLPGRRTSA